MPIARLSSADLYHELEAGGGAAGRVLVILGTGSDLRAEPRPFGWPGCERFAVLSYEHRGLGRSRPHGDAQPGMADFAADALELADHLGWPTFSVLGISFGGMVAQELALRAGDRVERLVLAVTSGGGALGSSYPLHDLYALAPDRRAELWAALLDTRARTRPELASALRAYLSRSGAGSHPPEGLLRQLEARRHHDVASRIGSLAVPCLVVAGRYDGIAPPQRASALAETIPGGRLAILDGGHGVLLQDPCAWPLIAGFLSCEL